MSIFGTLELRKGKVCREYVLQRLNICDLSLYIRKNYLICQIPHLLSCFY